MARSNQTFQKRQRENKLREKAQLKRQLREQRRDEKKKIQAALAQTYTFQPVSADLGSADKS